MEPRRAARGARAALTGAVVVAAILATSCSAGSGAVTSGGPATEAARGTAPVPPFGATAPPGTPPGSVAAPTTSTTVSAPTSTSTSAPTTTRAQAPTTPAPTTTAATARVHATATTSLPLVDGSRPTISRGTTVSSSRSLPTTVYYPSDGGGPYPLIVFAHGFQIGPGPYARFCKVLAAAGYVVAAPSFPLTDAGAAGSNLDRGDLPNQAGDVSFVATAVAGAANGAGPLHGLVDAGRLGVVGHSDGADTALDVGYYPGRNDSRFKAVAALSPDAMTGSGGSVGGGVPMLVQHGDRDSIVPYGNSRTVFGQVTAHRFFLTLVGADHLPPVQGAAPWAPVLDAVTVDFLDRYVSGRSASDREILEDGARQGVATITAAG